MIETLLPQVLQFIGVAVFAISGALTAGRKSLDLLGVVVIATVTAVGGGTLRDLLLDRQVFWIRNPAYLWVILISALLAVPYTLRFRPPDRILLLADALGLALFTIVGAQIAEGRGLSGIVVVIMGTLTGVAGGVLRDVLCAEIPLLFRPGRLYATTAIVGATVYLALQAVVEVALAAFVGMGCIVGLRLAAILWNLRLPVFNLPHTSELGP